MAYTLQYACISHVGKVRTTNQDNFICHGQIAEPAAERTKQKGQVTIKSNPPMLFGVFDGMGGEEQGEVASYLAAKEALALPLTGDTVQTLLTYCTKANEQLCRYAQASGLRAMGTTVALLLFTKKEITLCNIGDSKIFRYAKEDLKQLSKDHIIPSVFGAKPPLSQNLGIPPEQLTIEPYFSKGDYHHKDKYLICSDGLTDMLSQKEIQKILSEHSVPQAADLLVTQALEKGGKDNITVILLEIHKKQNKLLQLFTKEKEGTAI